MIARRICIATGVSAGKADQRISLPEPSIKLCCADCVIMLAPDGDLVVMVLN